MKKFIKRPNLFLSLAAVMGSVFLTQCIDPPYPQPVYNTTTLPTTNALIVNALPDSAIDFAVNNVVVLSNIPAGMASPAGYIGVATGPEVFYASVTGTSQYIGGTSIYPWRIASSSSTVTATTVAAATTANPWLFSGAYFTIVTMGTYGKRARIALSDNLSAPASGKANVRLVYSISGGGAILDTAIGLGGNTSPVLDSSGTGSTKTYFWGNKSNKVLPFNYYPFASGTSSTVSAFQGIDPTLNLSIYSAVTPAATALYKLPVLVSNIPANTLVAGKIYTIVVNKSSYIIIRHN